MSAPALAGSTRRVTIVTPRARVDVALPQQSTFAELVPQLVRLAGATGQAAADHPGWVLSRLGGAPLALGLTVAAAQVRDGEVLHLTPRERPRGPLLFDDVVDSIASVGDAASTAWGPRVARRAGIAAAVVLLAAGGLLVQASTAGSVLAPIATGLLSLILLLGGGALSRAYGDSGAGAAGAVAGVFVALLAGMSILPPHGVFSLSTGPLAAGLAAVTVYGVLAAVSVADRLPVFVAITGAAGLGALTTGVVLLTGVKPVAAAAVAAVLATALAAVAPMLALRLGRLPLPRVPDDMESFRANEQPSLGADVVGRTTYAQLLLTALLVALGLVVLGSAVTLAASGGPWEAGLAALTGIAWVQRSRSYAGRLQRLVLAGFGVITLLTAGAWLIAADDRVLLLVAGAALLIAAVVCLAYATRVAKGVRSPYWSRLLDVSEFLVLLALVPFVGMIAGVYQAVRG
ncbi:type VII secretion integral membrane protein EccD [Amycolatopsis rhabdoformis]|uniref:Type VII secretion integral membrane protein EccD n=1 Tax=Amycolatopsis rhabdoformis TaxID=1448059 RepID=A0ABZ1I8B9_9PSEU|nr:type VII secretion integral membrane protein EccD [Amycolatopsis rhabdoformis]WSE30612.1 type VII secretion integral membrane protein EccD [Amycolatopsis rhabdoformis]